MALLSRVLVVNAGSTSLKLSVVGPDETSTEVQSLASPPSDVEAVGHRVVHGGPQLVDPVVIDDTVLAEIEAGFLVCLVGAQRQEQADCLQQHEAHHAAVQHCGEYGDDLNLQLAGIAEDQTVDRSIEGFVRQHAREEGADRAANAVRRHHVERVVERRPGARR